MISGSAITPIVAAAWSPIDRAMASPRRLCHTREGEPLAPAGVTCPPICRMRFISPGESGLWSIVRSIACRAPGLPGTLRQTIARESPELAIHMWPSFMRHVTAVVPLTVASTWSLRSVSTRMYASLSAFPGSFSPIGASPRFILSAPGKFCMTNSETFSPKRPWPS